MGGPPVGETDMKNISRATKQEVITWENITDVKPGDHIEYSIHNAGKKNRFLSDRGGYAEFYLDSFTHHTYPYSPCAMPEKSI